ncbi:MAG: molybdopterin-dependent oxidoreductase [Actinobacteria bacterium]|nr:molybdopterin-dependent oxidoreductase [Actinomycetota bacterium]
MELTLDLRRLEADGPSNGETAYDLQEMRRRPWEWDRVVKSSHLVNCYYGRQCGFNVFVKDGVVLREEQVGNYPAPNDPLAPDANPRGCQKGVCYAARMYDPTRIKYPLKRLGERGEGKWRRLSWDEALTEVADAVIDTLVNEGPRAIFDSGGTQVAPSTSEGTGPTAFFQALGAPSANLTAETGDEHQGAVDTLGKVIFADSGSNWFYADMVLIWGGNPAYTNVPNYHYITEARYNGAKVVTITPDHSASAIHADQWVAVAPGTDAALALAMAQVIISEGLYKAEFVKEQTDLPLLVLSSTGKYLRAADLKRGGREDVFYVWDRKTRKIAEAPRASLALGELDPALEGTFEVETLKGKVAVRPVFEVLREHVGSRFTPEQASGITGVAARTIRELAREIAAAGGVVNIISCNWGKYYHGDLIERAIILVFALCGHMGRKGASYNALAMLGLDTALGSLEKRGDNVILAAAQSDPRFAAWREDGFSDEMILYEYVHQAFASGAITPTSLMLYLHGGILEQSEQFQSWDPDLKRPVGEYVREAFKKAWQTDLTEPKVMFAAGGNLMRRTRNTNKMIETFLPKLRMMVTLDWRWSSTALYSDIVLPVSGWYERDDLLLGGMTLGPWVHVANQAVSPLYESKSDWAVFVLLARTIEERARQRGLTSYKDATGADRKFAGLESKITFGGLYLEDDAEGLARDAYLNAINVEQIGWEELKEQGIANYTGVGAGYRSMGNACEIVPGEPIVPLTWHIRDKKPYPTMTRRIQFYVDQELFMELDEHLPTHKDNPKAGGDLPLQMTGGHARWSIQTSWADDTLMLRLQRGEPAMFMSAEDAAARGIADGEHVDVSNQVGAFRIRSIVSPAVRPGQVVIYHAWENFQFKDWKPFKNTQPSPLNPIELAGDYFHIRPWMANYPGFSDRGTRVEVRKAVPEAR